MDSAERQLKVLLTLTANTAQGEAQTLASLKRIEAQAIETGVAIGKAGQRIDQSGIITPANFDTGASARATALRAELDARVAAKAAAGQTAAADAASAIGLTQQEVIQERLQIIAATRFALAEALANGDRAQAELLRGELGIRQATLGVMRAETLTQAELNKLSASEEVLLGKLAQNAAATAAGGVLAGASLNKAKGEAIVLAREIATGSVNARTLGAFLGSLGPTLTIGAIAGYGLFEIISHLADDYLEFNKELDKTTGKLDQQAKKWSELARDAKDAKDLHGLTAAILPELNQLEEKLREVREKEVTGWRYVWDVIRSQFSTIPGYGPRPFQQEQDDAKKRLQILDDAAILRAHALIEIGKESAAAWDQVKIMPVADAIAIYANKLDDLRSKQSAVDTTTKQGIEKYHDLGTQIGETEEKLRILQGRTREVVQFETARLSELRQQQELITGNPLLSADEKNEQLHNLYLKERTTLLAQIIQLTALIKQLEESGQDKKLIGPLRKELQDVNFEVDKLSFKLKETGSFSDQLGVSLTSWVNGFGTAAQQVSGLIEGSINATLQGTNQLLLDAAFRTGDWQQTLVGVERQIGNLFLTFIEHQIESFILGETHKAASTATSITQAGAQLSAQAPLAAATSISSYGSAALIGEIAAVAAIAAIMAALSGGFKKGGFTGAGDPDEYAGPAHKGEFIFDAEATSAIGVPELEYLRRSAPHFGDGGPVNPYTAGGWFKYHPYTPFWGNRSSDPPLADTDFYNSFLATRFTGDPGNYRYPPLGNLDDDIPPADLYDPYYVPPVIPPIAVEPAPNPYGLPTEPGPPTPGLFPGDEQFLPRGPIVQVTGWPRQPGMPGWWNSPVSGLPWWSTFNPNLGPDLFTNVGPLGFGTRPGPGQVLNAGDFNLPVGYVNTNGDMWNGTDWTKAGPGSTNIVPPSDSSDSYFVDPMTGMTIPNPNYTGNPTSSSGPGGNPSQPTYDPGQDGRYNGSPGSTAGFFDPLFGDSTPELAPGAVSEEQFAKWYMGGGGSNSLAQLLSPPRELAEGGRIPGPASRSDTILSWLSTGERVIPAERNVMLERAFGFDWDRKLEVGLPRFADGARIGPVAAGVSPAGSAQPVIDVHVYNYTDLRKAQRDFEESPHARKVFRKNLGRYS